MLNCIDNLSVRDTNSYHQKLFSTNLNALRTDTRLSKGRFHLTGRGPSVWDTWVHEYKHVENNATGDVACDSYHRYREDVQLLRNLGVNIK